MILKHYALNMRRGGRWIKVSVINTLWNATAKSLKAIFFKNHVIEFDPYEDTEFLEVEKQGMQNGESFKKHLRRVKLVLQCFL